MCLMMCAFFRWSALWGRKRVQMTLMQHQTPAIPSLILSIRSQRNANLDHSPAKVEQPW